MYLKHPVNQLFSCGVHPGGGGPACASPWRPAHTARATSFTHILAEALHRRLGIALTARRIRCTTMPSVCTRYASAPVPKRVTYVWNT